MDKTDSQLLLVLQDNFPLVVRPYRVVAEGLDTDEEVVFARLREFAQMGLLRRLGPRYSSRRLGMTSTLSAARIAPGKLNEVAAFLATFPQVTHCYERTGSTCNLWFTLTARSGELIDRILADLADQTGVETVHNLPAQKVYKLLVRFVPTSTGSIPAPVVKPFGDEAPVELDDTDRRIVSATQRGLPLVPTPYTQVAQELGLTVEELLHRLSAMCASGVIRTMGAVLDGPALGYRGNALVAWQVPARDCDRVGALFADFDEVSHCYRRPVLADFPYPLYTMVHGLDGRDCERIVLRMSERSGVSRFVMLPTVREFRKTAVFFEDPVGPS